MGCEKFPLFKRGGAKSFTLSLGGAQKVSDPRFSHFVAPLLVINDESLISVEDLHGEYGFHTTTACFT